VIRLQRTSCFGPCPIYTVTIDARGTVHVRMRTIRAPWLVVGPRTSTRSIVARLLATADNIRFFEICVTRIV